MDPHSSSNEVQRSEQILANYQFSSDEQRILKECNTESFFQRSLPLGTTFGLAAYFGVKNGYISANSKYGAVPKIVLGVIAGYFIGKLSYRQKCAQKLMSLPNSKLGEILRQRSAGGGIMKNYAPNQELSIGLAIAPFTPSDDTYTEKDANYQSNALHLYNDTRPTPSELDDSYRPSLDNQPTSYESDIPIDPVKPGTSYEELRQRNRQEYATKQKNVYSRLLPPDTTVRKPEPIPNAGFEEKSFSAKEKVNKYGDAWTN